VTRETHIVIIEASGTILICHYSESAVQYGSSPLSVLLIMMETNVNGNGRAWGEWGTPVIIDLNAETQTSSDTLLKSWRESDDVHKETSRLGIHLRWSLQTEENHSQRHETDEEEARDSHDYSDERRRRKRSDG